MVASFSIGEHWRQMNALVLENSVTDIGGSVLIMSCRLDPATGATQRNGFSVASAKFGFATSTYTRHLFVGASLILSGLEIDRDVFGTEQSATPSPLSCANATGCCGGRSERAVLRRGRLDSPLNTRA